MESKERLSLIAQVLHTIRRPSRKEIRETSNWYAAHSEIVSYLQTGRDGSPVEATALQLPSPAFAAISIPPFLILRTRIK